MTVYWTDSVQGDEYLPPGMTADEAAKFRTRVRRWGLRVVEDFREAARAKVADAAVRPAQLQGPAGSRSPAATT